MKAGPLALRIVILAAWCAGVWLFLDRVPAALSTANSAAPSDPKKRHLDWNAYVARNLLNALPVANRFDFPLRPPDGEGAFVARPFGAAAGGHAGEDWNTAPGNGDLGEPVYAPADGWITLALDFQSAWGKVVLMVCRLSPGSDPAAVEMMFAHLDKIEVKPFQFVKRGDRIGTVGNADGVYAAHLHWEMRKTLGLGLGGAYADDLSPWFDPSEFVAAHRGSNGTSKAKRLPEAEWEKWGGD